jgi:hypothetical protein
MQQQPVGYQALTLTRPGDAPEAWLDASATSALSLQRFGQTTLERMELTSRETAVGQVESVESRIHSGGVEMHTVGRRQGDLMQFETRAGEQRQQWSVPLPAECGGYFALEWSLRRAPPVAGEQRTLHAIVPMLNQVAEIRVVAARPEAVALPNGTRQLLRLDYTLTLPGGTTINSVSWVDKAGEVFKAEMTELQQVSYRVDQATALAAVAHAKFDLGDFSTVRLAQPLAQAGATRQVRYRVELRSGDPASVFPRTASQSVVSVGPGSAELTVRALAYGDGEPAAPDDAPRDADRQPSSLVQSDDVQVRQLAGQIRPAATDAWSIATATEQFVYQNVTDKDFSTAFATAADVARSRQGDCTEHAVLMAALCRAQYIPCRAVIGLVYVDSQQGFVFHMWNEAWIQDRWISFDGTLGQAGISAAYLVLARSSLETGDAFATLLPVLQVMGQLQVEVLDVRYDGPAKK